MDNASRFTVLVLPALGAVALLAGCQSEHNDNLFAEDIDDRYVNNVYATYTDAGAADDAQFLAIHFDGGELNSLGQAKLDAMLRHAQGGDVQVYLDLADDDTYADARRTSLDDYLAATGVESDRVTVTDGFNPNGVPVAGLAAQSSATETAAASGEAAAEAEDGGPY